MKCFVSSACRNAVAPSNVKRNFSVLQSFATVDPYTMSAKSPGTIQNLVGGRWVDSQATRIIKDPMNGDDFLRAPDTQENELAPFANSMKKVSKSGTHNIYKFPERFIQYGEINHRVAAAMYDDEVFNFFVKCVQRVMPKSTVQAEGEVKVVRKFFENFAGDNVRTLMRGFVQAGDHVGQRSMGHRWPYGPVSVISPFNFPLEIPVMQFASAAMVGNKPVVKPESRVSLPVEQFLRLMHYCGLPKGDVDLLNCGGSVMSKLLREVDFRMTQFTGGSNTAHTVTVATNGRVKLEDAGFDWKVLGPIKGSSFEQIPNLLEYIAWQSDQDAYALSGQKCSAQSIAFVHEDWVKMGFLEQLKSLAARRSPVLSHSNEDIEKHLKAVLDIPGSKLLFGGKPLANTSVPKMYGSFEPTAVEVDMKEVMKDRNRYKTVTTELFGPFQIIVKWSDADENIVVDFIEMMEAHLTAAIVSPDPLFVNRMLAHTVNGTTYAGLRARTTGAPQNHWFGPAGTPLAAGIGSPEAVLSTWTCHREIVLDDGPLPKNWKLPPSS